MAAISKFLRLSWREQRLVAGAVLALSAVRIGLVALPFATVRGIVARRYRRLDDKRSRPTLERVTWAIEAASHYVPGGSNCLVRALASEYVLGRFGYPCELKIGVAKGAAGEFAAHAWLESDGRVVIGEFEVDRYTALVADEGRKS
jgi:transglutaminase superfamily protein